MKNILIFIFILSPLFLFSQHTNSRGIVINNSGNELIHDSITLVTKVGTYTKDGKIIWGTSEPVYQGPSLYLDGWLDTISPVHETILPYITTSRSTNPYVNTLELQQGWDKNPTIVEVDERPYDVTFNLGWKVETGWKALNKGRIGNCQEHNWLNASEQAGNYNTTKFEIGLSKGDMLQECRICVKCKRMETQLTFMGTGTNPFIWEATQSIYQQLLDEKK